MSLLSRFFGRGQTVTPAQALACISNRPMLMTPGALDVLMAAAHNGRMDSAVDAQFKDATGGSPEDLIEVENGVGFLTIRGPLFQRWGIEAWWYGGMSYDVIRGAFDMLVNDATVTRIVLDIDSPGGMVSGCFELAEHIFAARGTKPIDAVANDSAYSAAYAIASACDRIHLPNSGGVGSVGVVATHLDVSRYEDRVGVTYTHIVAGSKKVDGTTHAPLSESARSDIQAEVDRLAEMFVGMVARNRGLAPEAVAALQAGCLFGPAAITAGLADAIGTVESVAMQEPEDVVLDNPSDTGSETQASVASVPDAPANPCGLTYAQWRAEGEAEDANRAKLINRASVVNAIAAAKPAPDILAALIADDTIVPEAVDSRIAHAMAVTNLCHAAGIRSVAGDYITKHVDLETVRAQLIAAKAEDGPEINTTIPGKQSGTAGSGIWGETIKKFGG
jgi:signal peptide peptidase SppA